MSEKGVSEAQNPPLSKLKGAQVWRTSDVSEKGVRQESGATFEARQGEPPADIKRSRKAAIDTYSWLINYRRVVAGLDLISIIFAIAIVGVIRFDQMTVENVAGSSMSYPLAGGLIGLVWWVSLSANESRSRQIFGAGAEEYRRVIRASFYTFGFIAVISYLAGAQLSRLFFIGLLPVGMLMLLTVRWVCRSRLNAVRSSGEALVTTLVVGSTEEVHAAVIDMRRYPQAGFHPVAVCLTDHPDPVGSESPLHLPSIALERIIEELQDRHLGAVAVAGGLSRRATQKLAWELESSQVQLMVVPQMTDVAGPRVHKSMVEGLNLTHIDLPRYSGLQFWMKRSFDVAFASLALLLLFPVLLGVAVAIKLDDGGPILFRQERVGRGSQLFVIHKFRTMCLDAEDKIDALIQESGGTALLFKIENDPRITRVGRVLRKFSLDELPQFWTVLTAGMSIVGPRPQVAREVAEYTLAAHRRLLIKPGITGLWQVSGRSELSVEDSIRLDLRYVENWSLAGDIAIILRTIKVVLFPSGAY